MLEKRLCLFVCSNYADDVRYVLQQEQHQNVEVVDIDLNCTGPLLNLENLKSQFAVCQKKFDKVIVFGSSCLANMGIHEIPELDIEYVSLNQCFEMLLPPKLVEHFLQDRNYLVSSGWFDNFEENIANWGFEPKMAKSFFSEVAQNILFLETEKPFEREDLLVELSRYMGLPYEKIDIGSDYLRQKINAKVNKWKIEREREILRIELSKASRTSADYLLVFNQIESFLGLTDEESLLENVFVFFDMLYAPDNIVYIPFNSKPADWVWFKEQESKHNGAKPKFFSIPIRFNDESLGEFRIFEVKFPEHLKKYQEVTYVVNGMIGLALSNVKKYETISENENKLNEQTIQLSENIRIKDRFFSIIAHDLRSPFNSILGLSRVLKEDYYDLNDTYRLTMIEKLNQSADSYFQLLENLLEWAGTQTGRISFRPANIDFYAIVRSCLDIFENSFRVKGIRLKSLIQEGTMVYADPNMANTIVRNLISNALKFTPTGGRVEIKTLVTAKNSPNLKFCIQDTGVGIPAEKISKLFKEDEKVHSKGTENEAGSGLGLLLVGEMIYAHDCEIIVKSVLGQGSCFTFTLPRAKSV